MTVLPQLERELLAAQERVKPRRFRARRSGARITAGMVTLVASIAVTFGIAALFVLNVRGAHAPPARPAPHVSPSETGQHDASHGLDRALVRDFAILRRPLRPSDRLTGALAQIATPDAPISGDPRPTTLGLLPKLAREANLPGTQFRAWLIPGRHGLCWAAEYRTQVLGAFCSSFRNPATALTAADSDASVRTTTGLVTIGLVTDRVLGLALKGQHGQRQPVPITDGFYTVDGTGENLIATTATGSQALPRASGDLVLNTVGTQRTRG